MRKMLNEWDAVLQGEFCKPYYMQLCAYVQNEYLEKKVYPPREHIYDALRLVDYSDAKVVILGQDPYHGYGQANGLAFAVNSGVAFPPSLQNIFKEIQAEYGGTAIENPSRNNDNSNMQKCDSSLLSWAKQGVLLLNSSLSVREGEPNSHSNCGWLEFTSAILAALSRREKPMVFMLWGNNAISKKPLIDARHYILTAPHPSPLSAYRGFFGCNHFVLANEFLVKNGQNPINWA